jgi:HSP20 family protein
MSLSRFYHPLSSYYSEVDNLLDEAFRGRPGIFSNAITEKQDMPRALKPRLVPTPLYRIVNLNPRFRMNLYEDPKDNMIIATFELPGLTKDKVNIDVDDQRLVVSGELSKRSEINEDGFVVKECNTGRFYRAVGLPPHTPVFSFVDAPLVF